MPFTDPHKYKHYLTHKNDYIQSAKRWRKSSPEAKRKFLAIQKRYKTRIKEERAKELQDYLYNIIPAQWTRHSMTCYLTWNGLNLSYSLASKYFKINDAYRTKDPRQFIAQAYMLSQKR